MSLLKTATSSLEHYSLTQAKGLLTLKHYLCFSKDSWHLSNAKNITFSPTFWNLLVMHFEAVILLNFVQSCSKLIIFQPNSWKWNSQALLVRANAWPKLCMKINFMQIACKFLMHASRRLLKDIFLLVLMKMSLVCYKFVYSSHLLAVIQLLLERMLDCLY